MPVDESGNSVPKSAPEATIVPIRRSDIFSRLATAMPIGIIIELAGSGPGPSAVRIEFAKKKKIGIRRFFPRDTRSINAAIRSIVPFVFAIKNSRETPTSLR